MAGFRSPLFVLGLGSTSERAGYRSALPLPSLGVPGAEQAGFRSPLPIPPFGADAIQRAGFATPLPIYGLWAGDPIDPPEPDPVQVRRGSGGIQARLHAEDEAILAVIVAASKRRRFGYTGE